MATTFADFKEAYTNAKKHGWVEFHLDGNEFVTEYAKFMIEWLVSRGCPNDAIIQFQQMKPCNEVIS